MLKSLLDQMSHAVTVLTSTDDVLGIEPASFPAVVVIDTSTNPETLLTPLLALLSMSTLYQIGVVEVSANLGQQTLQQISSRFAKINKRSARLSDLMSAISLINDALSPSNNISRASLPPSQLKHTIQPITIQTDSPNPIIELLNKELSDEVSVKN